MKATIFAIKRFAVHDGDGIRTTVFFKGCPLRCVWCHNPEGLFSRKELSYFPHKCIDCGECVSLCPAKAHAIEGNTHVFHRERCIACGQCAKECLGNALYFYGKEYTVEELLPLLLLDKDFYAQSGGGVTLSGGECLLQADFCAQLLQALKEHGIHTAVDTCGFVDSSALQKVLPYTDVFLYDLKAIDETTHRLCTGQSNQRILENLAFLDASGCAIEIRIPLIPDYNDDEMQKIADFLQGLHNVTKIKVLPYHPYAGTKYESLGISPSLPSRTPTKEELAAVAALFSSLF